MVNGYSNVPIKFQKFIVEKNASVGNYSEVFYDDFLEVDKPIALKLEITNPIKATIIGQVTTVKLDNEIDLLINYTLMASNISMSIRLTKNETIISSVTT